MLKKPQPTGVVPVDADHDRWAYMRDGRVIWAGSQEECMRRYRAFGVIKRDPDLQAKIDQAALDRAIRAI